VGVDVVRPSHDALEGGNHVRLWNRKRPL
jgi:hypothetical protein